MQSTDAKAKLDVLRGTPEYSAIFDLEVWRAEQRQKFLESLEEEKKRLKQSLENEYAARDAKRVAELDEFRRELEGMAIAFKKSGEQLQQKIANLEKREAAFDARRLQVAREQEGILLAAESKARQVREEMKLKVELLQSQLEEKERLVQQTTQRLNVISNEFEALQHTMSRVQSKEIERQAETSLLTQSLQESNQAARQAREDAIAASKAKEAAAADSQELRAACLHYKRQLKEVASAHNELLKQLSQERMQFVAQEREKMQLMEASRHVEQARQRQPTAPSPSAIPPPPTTEIAALRQLITEIVEAPELNRKVKRQGQRSASKGEHRAGVLQQVLPATSNASKPPSKPQRSEHPDYHRHYVPVAQEGDLNTQFAAGTGLNQSTESAVVYSLQSVPPGGAVNSWARNVTDRHEPVNQESQPSRAPPGAAGQPEDEKGDGVSLSSMSSQNDTDHGPALPTADDDDQGNASARGNGLEVHQRTTVQNPPRAGNGERPPTGAGAAQLDLSGDLPLVDVPVPVTEFVSDRTTQDERSSTRTVETTSSSAQHSYEWRHPPVPSSLTSTATQAMGDSADFRSFLSRLRSNRDKLLDSGVYGKEDSLIKEMERKMALYEEFLRSPLR